MIPLLYPWLHRLRQILWAERGSEDKKFGCGMLPDEIDDRDFNLGIFGWGEYKPKHDSHQIDTLSIKNQRSFNTCVLNSATVQKEIDEKVVLSVRFLVCLARREGKIQGNGFSSLRDIQKLVQEYGICEERLLPDADVDWETYSNPKLLTPEMMANAALHKSQTYWYTMNRSDTLKLLDEGRILHTGMDWYSGYNMNGGFKLPWIIQKVLNFLVGGHAFDIIGYRMNYEGQKVYTCQNSYDRSWGDNGKFYVTMDFFDKVGFQRYAQLDMPVEVASVIAQYQGQFVKDLNGSAIYFITENTKRAFPDWETFLAYGGGSKKYTKINGKALQEIPDGPVMDITQSSYWPYIKDQDKSQWMNTLLTVINQR